MAEKKPTKVSIQAAVTDSSLSIGIKSRALAALARLIGGLIGIPAAMLERIEDRINNQADRVALIQDAAAKRIGVAVLNDEDVKKVIAELALASQLAPIVNRAQVAKLTVEELRNDIGSDGPQAAQGTNEEVDEDWLNHFGAYSERASSDHVRQLWAKVLAGEIRHAGSFSLTSLRLLSELDREMATTFESEVKYRIDNAAILKPKTTEMVGQRLESLTFLSEVGLLQAIDPVGGVVRPFSPNNNGVTFLQEQHLLLYMKLQQKFDMDIIPLTRAGRELATILPPANPEAVLEQVGIAIKDNVVSMEIRVILEKSANSFRTVPLKILKAESQ